LEPAIEILKERVSTLSERKTAPPQQHMSDFEEGFGEGANLQAHVLVDNILAKLKVRELTDNPFRQHLSFFSFLIFLEG